MQVLASAILHSSSDFCLLSSDFSNPRARTIARNYGSRKCAGISRAKPLVSIYLPPSPSSHYNWHTDHKPHECKILPEVAMSMIDKTLGYYSLSALLGKGVMGEVYQAKNQKSATSCLESGEDIWFCLNTIMTYLYSKIRAGRSLK